MAVSFARADPGEEREGEESPRGDRSLVSVVCTNLVGLYL